MSRRARPVTPVGIAADILGRVSASQDLHPSIAEDLRLARVLLAGLEPYTSDSTSPESPALAAVARRTRARDWDDRPGGVVAVEQEMLSGHVEGKLLQFLVAITGARRVLEIGMFTGYSALAIAEVLPVGGRLVACELDPEVAAFAQEQFDAEPAGAAIDVRVGPANDTLEALCEDGEAFDLVFVDADKPGYLGYVTTLLDTELLAPDGLICVDNTLLRGEPYLPSAPTPEGEAIAMFNATIAGDPRVEQVMLAVRDGVTLIRRR